MNRIRRMTAWAAAVLLLLAPGIRAGAEVTAEKQTERGRVTEITWKDENGNITAGPEGYATVRYEYEYQKTTERYYDAEGFPYETAGGYYGRVISTDSFLVITDYIGINGNLTNTKMGYARVERRTFMFGLERFTVYYDDNEQHIPQRLEREKRCGTVEQVSEDVWRFSADVYDASEMLPWIRTRRKLLLLMEYHSSSVIGISYFLRWFRPCFSP